MRDKKDDKDDLREAIEALAPWHLVVRLRDGVDTRTSISKDSSGADVSIDDDWPGFSRLMRNVYAEGLNGKSFLDIACNCGGYCFYAKDMGAATTFGIDVREHWIQQAKFLKEQSDRDTSGMTFQRGDLYDIPSLNLPLFDITWFKGIFYHLPDPVTGLKIAADQTRELLYVNTAITGSMTKEKGKGQLHLKFEDTNPFMSGVHGLSWLPSGPVVLTGMLKWLGFNQTRIIVWIQSNSKSNGRIGILASRSDGLLDKVPEVSAPKIANATT